ncbi:MAG: EAL domain-containing protein [Acidimicrobiales bacterium]
MAGNPNQTAGRQVLVDRLEVALHRLRRNPTATFALLHVCVDPQAGSAPLPAADFLQPLREVLWVGDLVAEIGPGRLAIACEDVADEHAAAAIARRVVDALVAARAVSVSVGVVVATPEHVDGDELLAEAAFALTGARASGGGYELSDAGLRDSAAARLDLEASMRLAIERSEFRVAYQPAFRLDDGAIIGVEALLRWEHPTRGLVPPAAFMAAAEATNLILPIGRWVLDETCRQLATWRDEHPEVPLVGSVNLSAAQLVDPSLPGDIRFALTASQIDPASLCLEVNESDLMSDPAAAERALRRLRAEGVRLAIDDFGTGSSSLSWLERFPIDILKVDRAFVSGIGSSHVDTAVVRAVIGLASSLGLTVVAVGVETAGQLDALRGFGCSAGQGYLWSRPVPADELAAVLSAPAPSFQGAVPSEVGDGDDPPAAEANGERHVLDLLVHELRTPLTVITGFAETLGDGIADGDTSLLEVGLTAIRRQVQSIDSMFRTLVDTQAIGAGTLVLDCEPVDGDEFIPEVVADLATTVPERDVIYERRGAGGAELLLDRGRIREVLANLVGNAAKYSPAGSPIEIVLDVMRHEVVVHVIDHGPGIPPERAGDVFRKFARLERNVKGTGLGLYIARGISRSHGGDLECRPAPGGGAEFVLSLPRAASGS